MRDYGKISSKFWTGETGRRLRKLGRDEQLLAVFLFSGPTANMIGLYHLPLAIVAHYLGFDEEGAWKALRRVQGTGFCQYDAASEHVWVPEMAAQQIGDRIDQKDNRFKAIIKEWSSFRKSPYYLDFYRRYVDCFGLPDPSPSEAPSKPLRSQEQEQEQEQNIEQKQEQEKTEDSSESLRATSEPLVPVMIFPTVGNPKEWALTESKLAEYRESFPGVDVLCECRAARQWSIDNPQKRKTARGMPSFLSRWLMKCQNSGGNSRGSQSAPTLMDEINQSAAKFLEGTDGTEGSK